MGLNLRKGLILSISSLLILGVIFVYEQGKYFDGRLHVVFCDVGQGDAIYIRTAGGADILVDGGPDNKVLDCLTGHIPFWNRDLDLVFLTHPDSDHLTGLIEVLKRYEVKNLNLNSNLDLNTPIESEFQKLLKEKKIEAKVLVNGDSFKTQDGVRIKTLWPGSNNVLGVKSGSDNNLSLVEGVFYKDFSLLLTGDVEAQVLDKILNDFESLDVLKIPHHGSKTALGDETFSKIKPGLALISVGEKNRYHHPSGVILSKLKKEGITYKRTDLDGEVEIVTDGKEMKIVK